MDEHSDRLFRLCDRKRDWKFDGDTAFPDHIGGRDVNVTRDGYTVDLDIVAVARKITLIEVSAPDRRRLIAGKLHLVSK